MKKENIIKYGNPILGVMLVAILGTIFTNMGLEWLDSLNKPSSWPKNYAFPIVWIIIYCGFTVYLLYIMHVNKLNKKNLTFLIINGFLNVFWCFIYFMQRNILLGLVTIIINLFVSILLSKQIYLTNKKWGYVLLIYPIWLSIATCLNLAVWILN